MFSYERIRGILIVLESSLCPLPMPHPVKIKDHCREGNLAVGDNEQNLFLTVPFGFMTRQQSTELSRWSRLRIRQRSISFWNNLFHHTASQFGHRTNSGVKKQSSPGSVTQRNPVLRVV